MSIPENSKYIIFIFILLFIVFIGYKIQQNNRTDTEKMIGGVGNADYVLNQDFMGIPAGTLMRFDTGKYVPVSVSGYESKADYPDNFWIRGQNIQTMRTISTQQ